MLDLRTPKVHVFDPDGKLPLNLQRNDLAGGKLPFDDSLLEAVFDDFSRYAAEKAPDGFPGDADGYFERYAGLGERDHWSSKGKCSPWVWIKSGLTVADPVLLNKLNIDALLFMPPWMIDVLDADQGRSFVTSYEGGIIPFTESVSRSERTRAAEFLFAGRTGSVWSRFVEGSRGRRVLFRSDLYEYILGLKTSSYAEKSILTDNATEIAQNAVELAPKKWFLVSSGECPDEPVFQFSEFVSQFGEATERLGPIDVVAELYRSEDSLQARNSKMADVWTSVIGGAAIPFRGAKRDSLREGLQIKEGSRTDQEPRSA